MPRRILTISDHDRRMIALGATCILLMIFSVKVVPAKRRWDARTEMRSAVLASEVADARSLLNHETVTRKALNAGARALATAETGLLHAETKSGGETALAALVSTAAASSGIKVDGLALDTDVGAAGSLRTVSVTGGATGDVQGLVSFLGAIERAPSRLAVRALSITQPDPAAADSRAETLRLEFTVQALAINISRATR